MSLIEHIKGQIRESAKRGNKLAQFVTREGPRSPHWPVVEKRWRKTHPYCAACGSSVGVQVHHAESFATHPELELWDCSGVAPGTGPVGGTPNLISLCERAGSDHHLLIGHGGSFSHGGYNPNVVNDAAAVKADATRLAEIVAAAKAARVTPPVQHRDE